MTTNDKMEELSRNFILAIAHNRGYFDYNGRDYGTDLLIRKSLKRLENRKQRYLSSGKAIDVQLKSVFERNVEYKVDVIKYKLEVKNYNDLVTRANENGATIPMVLVVYVIPDDELKWIKCQNDGTLLKKEAYWYILPPNSEYSKNTSKVTIEIPLTNRIDEELFPNLWNTLF